jgi:hypothetical protein
MRTAMAVMAREIRKTPFRKGGFGNECAGNGRERDLCLIGENGEILFGHG